MPEITVIPSPSTGSGNGDSSKISVNGAKTAEIDDTDLKSQHDEVSFLDSFQQRLALISEQSEETQAAVDDGNILPISDEAAACYRLISDQPALIKNAIMPETKVADPRSQLRGSASVATSMQTAVSSQAVTAAVAGDAATTVLAEPGASETHSMFNSRMLQMATDQTGDMATDRRALEMLMSGGRTPPIESANAIRAPAPMTTATVDAATSATGQTSLTETLGHPEWGQGLGRQVLWMVNQNMRSAEMRLNPANLGPIEVRIDMDDDQVRVAFNSRHAVVREALELAMPRLREMFDANGMNLANTDISHQSFAEQHRSAFSGDNESQQHGFASNLPTLDDMQAAHTDNSRSVINDGLIDCYI